MGVKGSSRSQHSNLHEILLQTLATKCLWMAPIEALSPHSICLCFWAVRLPKLRPGYLAVFLLTGGISRFSQSPAAGAVPRVMHLK